VGRAHTTVVADSRDPPSSPASRRLCASCPVSLRIATCQNLVFSRRFSKPLNISPGHSRNYVSRKDAKTAKVNCIAALSSWHSLCLGDRTGFACGRRPRWDLRVLRGDEVDYPPLRPSAAPAVGQPSLVACASWLAPWIPAFAGRTARLRPAERTHFREILGGLTLVLARQWVTDTKAYWCLLYLY